MHIAFAGFRHGHITGLFKEALQASDISITGCFEADPQARKAMEDSLAVDFNYHSYEELLTDPSVEVVVIGDYYSKRGSMVIDALKHGKHVICDKPICTELDELDQIQDLVTKHSLQVMCMLDLRYMSTTVKAKEIIQQGVLGDLRIISFTGQHFLDYGNRPGWYFEAGKHGGTINDIGIHGVDLVRYLTGKNLSRIDCAKTWNAFAEQEPDFLDCAQFICDLEGISVMADVSYAAPRYGEKLPTYWNFYFWGTKGMMNISINDDNVHIFTDYEEVIPCEASISTYFSDLKKEICRIPTNMNSIDMLESQRQILKIQKHADQG